MITTTQAMQVKQQALDINIRSLFHDRFIYENYPSFQREKVWKLRMKQYLIDSIFRGFYIPAILAFSKKQLLLGEHYWVIDGQQRLSAIFEFMENKFPTMNATHADEPHYKPIEPGKYYRDLSQENRDILNTYRLHFKILEDVDPTFLGVMFRRLQNQVRLTGAEKLFSYTSETTARAVTLLDHQFWREQYAGQTDRKNTFQSCLYIFMLELANGYANVTMPSLKDLAAGTKDKQVNSDDFAKKIVRRLDEIHQVFKGIQIHNMREIIPLYQCAIFLDDANYDLKKSKEGCLTPWFLGIQQFALETNRARFANFYEQLTKNRYQRQFWAEHLNTVFTCEGLASLDKRRAFDQLDRLRAYSKQNGICPICKKQVKQSDIGHHIIRYTDGGKTIGDNCALVHKECHVRIHSNQINSKQGVLELFDVQMEAMQV